MNKARKISSTTMVETITGSPKSFLRSSLALCALTKRTYLLFPRDGEEDDAASSSPPTVKNPFWEVWRARRPSKVNSYRPALPGGRGVCAPRRKHFLSFWRKRPAQPGFFATRRRRETEFFPPRAALSVFVQMTNCSMYRLERRRESSTLSRLPSKDRSSTSMQV